MLSIYLLRHAETEYNAHNQFIGGRSNHLALSNKGREEAKEIGKRWRDSSVQFDKIFCSIANRAQETLETILSQSNITDNPVVYSTEIQELSQGDWEGKPRSDIYTVEQLAEINANQWLFKPPNGESQKEVEERMLAFLSSEILEKYTEGNFLIVGHGVAFKCLLRNILGISSQMAYKLMIENVSLTKLRYDDTSGWHIDYINRIYSL
ncbi:broad specificity phosphatase PhoE [Parabacteroides sp. PF5-5]|uniref:histidine phosphatase family protein n=1 Tax=unclassified Parabacteroides TaxID=2649774 RepID=UPI0024743E55|nr:MULTISPECIES: histidine phosphatase family protein [unclassified Parabacteroides]MDH6303989.1 broad specificity phosphatase PhoE [Parabacteroides sp. PH5-39]MDH6314604.1 broad specificity phosphatase PhoE [Parabacteroides sp. PF5-13]MDH6318330.1 broad specificity phosphatase PhoE [Parabacteroides sp. PH5-13]MDH6322378.1 broad specificity phosphatase PhoE [Parabacteroides sp. PH5-8]MDH6325544.1 broad specificity phosphatase PhoE [Parabacteroides sp. PH5-41]